MRETKGEVWGETDFGTYNSEEVGSSPPNCNTSCISLM